MIVTSHTINLDKKHNTSDAQLKDGDMVTTSMYNNNDGLNDANAILIHDNERVVMDNTNDNVELVETLSINTTSHEGSMVSNMPFIFKYTQYVKLPARLEHDMQIIKNVWQCGGQRA